MSVKVAKAEEFIKTVLRHSGDPHNIFTPFALCREVLEKIPSLDGTILVVANLEFLYTLLMMGVDPSRVYFATPNDMKARAAKQLKIAGIYNYNNVITGEDVGDMKFDVVVGNPPYQVDSNDLDSRKRKGNPGRLFVRFVNMFRTLSKTYAVVMPSTWIGRPNDKLNKEILSDTSVEYIIDVTNHFPFLKGRLHVCCVVANERYNDDKCTMVNEDDTEFKIVRSDIKGFMSVPAMNIIQKLNTGTTLGSLWHLAPEIIRENLSDIGTSAVAEIVGAKDTPVPIRRISKVIKPKKHLPSTYRVIVNVNASKDHIGNVKYIGPGIFVTQSLRFFPVNSEDEARHLVNYLESSLVQYIAKTVRSSNGNSKAFFNNIPLVDFTRSWTDEELYEHFDLTEEEIKLIEDTIS